MHRHLSPVADQNSVWANPTTDPVTAVSSPEWKHACNSQVSKNRGAPRKEPTQKACHQKSVRNKIQPNKGSFLRLDPQKRQKWREPRKWNSFLASLPNPLNTYKKWPARNSEQCLAPFCWRTHIYPAAIPTICTVLFVCNKSRFVALFLQASLFIKVTFSANFTGHQSWQSRGSMALESVSPLWHLYNFSNSINNSTCVRDQSSPNSLSLT